MPRKARKLSISGYYHVIFRGVNKQDIFLDDKDRLRLLRTLDKYRKETGVTIAVYCLMDNHVHILAKAGTTPGRMVQKTLCSYVSYMNKKYERVGHLFCSRHYSEPVETERAVLAVSKYILRNPQKAGLSTVQGYPWSSWRELAAHSDKYPKICDASELIALAGGEEAFADFVLAGDSEEAEHDGAFYKNGDDDFRTYRRWSEKQALERMLEVGEGMNPFSIAALPKKDRNYLLRRFKEAGISVRQISRLTGIDRNTIQRA